MPTAPQPHAPRLSASRREGERVTALELFFDLVFVLAITQCTALMAHHPTWSGMLQGLLVLGVLWWGWVGYAWLTSVIDPEETSVRFFIFVAMAALLIVSLCVPEAFGSLALTFALAFGVFRVAHIALFMVASADEDALRHSVLGLAASTATAVSLLIAASFFDGLAQGALWALAIFVDMAGPYFFGSEGWRLVPWHFAERHGLIILIALGESIVAIGVGAAGHLDFGIGTAAVLGVALAAALWWIYFDVVALVSAQRLAAAEPGRAQNELARDSYSYVHYALVAGIVLTAFGLKTTIGHTDEHLHDVPAFALLGGVAIYLLGLIGFRYRHVRSINPRRLGLAIVLLLLVSVATAIPAIASLAVVDVLMIGVIAYEHRGYGEGREELRQRYSVAHTETTETPETGAG
ncbi:MAG TPA: low temperature requirement protein A [Solirubrobacterales bacterium]|nr:low temperature requirement protein A [Solirubrobacterales bacterium]